MTASVQLENKITGRESQGACRQGELIGSKPPVVKILWLTDSEDSSDGMEPPFREDSRPEAED
jgi:hypothetical protein